MATEGPFALRYGQATAGADLSTHQFKFVKLGTTEGTVILCADAADRPIGVLQNAPTSGQPADVLMIGVTKISSDAALADGVEIGTSADGQADAKVRGTDLDEYIVGVMLSTTSAAAEIGKAAINCIAPPTAAAVA